MLLREEASFPLAQAFRNEGAAIGEVFRFISGLYFRGKLAYAEAFADAPACVAPALIITPGEGLVTPDTFITRADLERSASIPIEGDDPRYREPLERHARQLAAAAAGCQIVLLGSVATPKYLDPLLTAFGERLVFPEEFVGRGDMSRGGLMLRAAQARQELTYIQALGAIKRGKRPPKLGPAVRTTSGPAGY